MEPSIYGQYAITGQSYVLIVELKEMTEADMHCFNKLLVFVLALVMVDPIIWISLVSGTCVLCPQRDAASPLPFVSFFSVLSLCLSLLMCLVFFLSFPFCFGVMSPRCRQVSTGWRGDHVTPVLPVWPTHSELTIYWSIHRQNHHSISSVPVQWALIYKHKKWPKPEVGLETSM